MRSVQSSRFNHIGPLIAAIMRVHNFCCELVTKTLNRKPCRRVPSSRSSRIASDAPRILTRRGGLLTTWTILLLMPSLLFFFYPRDESASLRARTPDRHVRHDEGGRPRRRQKDSPTGHTGLVMEKPLEQRFAGRIFGKLPKLSNVATTAGT